jgi:hypothetical protein
MPNPEIVDLDDGFSSVNLGGQTTQVLTPIVTGPPGPAGPPGPQGPQGPAGEGEGGATGVYVVYNFASPSDVWTLNHGLDTYALNVITADQNGEEIEGNVQYIDSNTIEIGFYYPQAGEARLFR